MRVLSGGSGPSVPMLKNSTMSALEENKALVRRHLEEAVNLGRPEVWSDIMAEDFLLHHPLVEPGSSSYEKHGFALYRVANRQLAECWMQEDDQGFQQQLFS